MRLEPYREMRVIRPGSLLGSTIESRRTSSAGSIEGPTWGGRVGGRLATAKRKKEKKRKEAKYTLIPMGFRRPGKQKRLSTRATKLLWGLPYLGRIWRGSESELLSTGFKAEGAYST